MKKPRPPLSLKIFSLIVVTDVLEALTQLFFKKGAVATHMVHVNFSTFPQFAAKLLTGPLVWIGILVYVLNFFIWMAVLFQIDLSVAFPVGSTSHLMVPFLAVLFLRESVSPIRWIGILMIVSGIYFIQRSMRAEAAA